MNERSKTFSVIDGPTHTVVATESLRTRPWDVVRCPVNNKLYVLGHNPDVVAVVDCETYVIDTTIAFPCDPYGVCYDSTDNRVYVATRADSTVRAIDCATNTIIATIQVGPAPNKLCWNSNDNKVYTATVDFNDSTVAVIDCASNTVIAMLKPDRYPHRVSYDPAYNRVYVSCYSGYTVVVIDGATNQIVATVPTTGSPEGSCAVPQHSYVFVAVRNDTVLVLNAFNSSVIARVGVGDGPSLLLYNPTDDRVYTTDSDSTTVSILHASGTGIKEGLAILPDLHRGPTIVHGMLNLQAGRRQYAGYRAELLNAAGQKVIDLVPGANDIRRLVPGVYFIKGEWKGLSKVVIVR